MPYQRAFGQLPRNTSRRPGVASLAATISTSLRASQPGRCPLAATLPLDEPLPPREVAQRSAILAHDVAVSLPEPVNNGHASAHYRRRMIEVLLRRNLGALADGLA